MENEKFAYEEAENMGNVTGMSASVCLEREFIYGYVQMYIVDMNNFSFLRPFALPLCQYMRIDPIRPTASA